MAFECGICASMFNTGARIPLILECGHTFCQGCVSHNLGAQRCCPYCRHPIQKHVDELPRWVGGSWPGSTSCLPQCGEPCLAAGTHCAASNRPLTCLWLACRAPRCALCRNYALENAMEAANLPLVELMDRWGQHVGCAGTCSTRGSCQGSGATGLVPAGCTTRATHHQPCVCPGGPCTRRWGLANAERMMVKADQLQLVSLMSRKGHTGEVSTRHQQGCNAGCHTHMLARSGGRLQIPESTP